MQTLPDNQEETEWKDIDLNVTLDTGNVSADLLSGIQGAEEAEHKQISMAFEGTLGFTGALYINLDSANEGRTANLFYYNTVTGQLEQRSAGVIDRNGYVPFNLTEASDYVMLIDNGEIMKAIVKEVTVAQTKKTLYIGGNTDKKVTLTTVIPESLQAFIADGYCTQTVTYKSSNPQVATVSRTGTVKALKEGKTTITATVTINGVTKVFQTKINVEKAYINLIKSTDTMKKGKSYTFQAVGYGVDTEKITWITTQKSIVVINKNTGKATAKATGTDYVVAHVGNVNVMIKINVIT